MNAVAIKPKKQSFLLKIDNLPEIDAKYTLTQSNLTAPFEQTVSEEITKIDELSSIHRKTPYIPFIDETRKFTLTMVGLPKPSPGVELCCFWDRHPFSTIPVGCPIAFRENKIKKVCCSDVTKEKYIVKQNISLGMSDTYNPKANEEIIQNNYYEIDGFCCSFNCALSYMLAFHNDPKIHLLTKMYLEIFNETTKIHPAPDWKLLEEYGGVLNISEYRGSFGKLQFIDQDCLIHKLPKTHMLGTIFEEQFIF